VAVGLLINDDRTVNIMDEAITESLQEKLIMAKTLLNHCHVFCASTVRHAALDAQHEVYDH
jgi:hypothetical protein